MLNFNNPVGRLTTQATYLAPPPPAPPPPPPPAPVPAPAWPTSAWPSAAGPTAPPPGTPAIQQPYTAPKSWGALAMLDLANMATHPLKTLTSLFVVTKDIVALEFKRGLTVASAPPVLAQYNTAYQHLDEAPFKHVLPFFNLALDKWADGRWRELTPEVQARLSQRAWHPIQLEWPNMGTGHDRLSEVTMLNDAAATATDGQIVRALQGANRVQFKDSSAMDYFYPVAREGDALIFRRNLPLIPGQKSIAENMQGLLTQAVQVHIN